ncbi:MAG TPA: ATP-binding protein [Vicinamibacteria bacterium]
MSARAGDADRYRRTLDNLLEGFQIVAPDWTYLYVNPAAARQGRREPGELEGRRMPEAYPGIDRTPLWETMTRCMRERTPASVENLFTYPDGSTGWFELRIEPVPEGLCIHSVDIQQRKDAEASLRAWNERLEAQVAERTRELEALNHELEAFSYSVSHDLRAPLRHVTGFAQLLDRHAGPALDEKGRDYVAKIVDAAARMGRLIDDLLSLSRTGRAVVQKRPVSLAALLRDAQKELAAETEGRAVIWETGSLGDVHADPGLLRLVLVNLLSNALKYTRGREPARVSVSAERGDREVVVCVRDNGVGFDMQYAGKLFGVFQRLHSSDVFEGTGIGLANVRQIVRRHGGRTWAVGAPDQGASFFFSLPAGAEAAAADPRPGPPSQEASL